MTPLNDSVLSVTAFAPATSANVIAGFDILGFPIPDLGDTVTITRQSQQGLTLEIASDGYLSPAKTTSNVATLVIEQVITTLQITAGFVVHLKKGIPMSSGLGGSAASSIAALVAFNGFLKQPLSTAQILHYALFGEEKSGGTAHADNITPCLLGGLHLISAMDPIEYVPLPHLNLPCVLIHPHLQIVTKQSRQALQSTITLQSYVQQSRHLATFIAGLYRNDITLLKRGLQDVLIEPQRAKLLPCFYQVKKAALDFGAIAASFSGSGPSMFALAENTNQAKQIASQMQAAFWQENIASDYWITAISEQGAHIIEQR